MKHNYVFGVLRHVKKFRRYAAVSVLFKAANHLASIAFVLFLADVIIGRTLSSALVLQLSVTALAVLLLKYWDEYVSHKMSFLILEHIRNAVFERYYEIAPGAVEDINAGDFAQMLVNDINVFEWFIGHILIQWLGFLSAFFIFIGRYYSLIGAKVFLLALPVVCMAWLMVRDADRQERLGVELKDEAGRMMAEVVDGVIGMKDILIYEHEAEYLQKIRRNSKNANAAKQRFFSLMSRKNSGNELLCLSTLLLILLCSGSQLDFTALFLTFVGSYLMFRVSVMTLRLTQTYGMVYGAAGRVFRIYDLKPTISGYGKVCLEEVEGTEWTMTFQDVSFRYPKKDVEVLKNLNFTVKSGERLALVSASGGGKSTITKLLLRFFDPTSGRILLNGRNLKELNEESLRKAVTIVPQDPFLFDTSIYNNLRYVKPDASEKELVRAMKRANSFDFISRLPDGIRSSVGERGGFLSGGQRQRIALTQAFLKDSPILILDEFSSALDAQNEAEIYRTIEEMVEKRIVFLISHKPELIRTADRIIFLSGGSIEQVGTYQELMENEHFREVLRKEREDDVEK